MRRAFQIRPRHSGWTVSVLVVSMSIAACSDRAPPTGGLRASIAPAEDPIALWRAAEPDRAIEVVLEWSIGSNPPPLVRAMSEREFASLSFDEQAAIRKAAEAQGMALREIARELSARAEAASHAGDRTAAASHVAALRALATAHQGDRVLAITQLVGKAIGQIADWTEQRINGG